MKKTLVVLAMFAAFNVNAKEGTFTCDYDYFQMVGGTPIYKHSGRDAIVVDKGKTFAIAASTFNVESGYLVKNEKGNDFSRFNNYEFLRGYQSGSTDYIVNSILFKSAVKAYNCK